MSFVNRIFFLTTCWSSIRVVQSDAVSMSTRYDIDVAVQGSSTPVTISLTADITNFNYITVGNGKDVTIVSNNDQQKTLTSSSSFFDVEAGGSLTLERITLVDGSGGAISNHGSLTVTNCTFSGNTATYYGGAIYNYDGSLTVTDCTFSGNTASEFSSGGAIYNYDGSLTVTDCTFSGNTASEWGGAIYNRGPLTVTDCTFSGNTASYGRDIYHTGALNDYTGTLTGCDVNLDAYCSISPGGSCCTAAPTTAPTATPVDSTSNGDPHLQFADGGTADFRGSHNGIYNMLTSQNISVNALFREQDFFQSAAGIEFADRGLKQGDKFLVHGTFMFEAYTIVRTSSGRLLHLRTESTTTSSADVAIIENNVPVSMLNEHDQRMVDDIKITTQDGVTTIATPEWVVLCKIVRTEKAHFLNLSFKSISNSSSHGIIGQSYDHDGVSVDGAKDVYNSVHGGETTTTAQAEGAIEGVHSDYLMESPFATAYKYSRFNTKNAAVRDVRKLVGTKKRSVDHERRKLAFLLQRMAGKDNVVGAD